MIDLEKLAVLLGSAAYCGVRNCTYCKEYYHTGDSCPMWINKENTAEALDAIANYLDLSEYKQKEVTKEEFLNILNGTYEEKELAI